MALQQTKSSEGKTKAIAPVYLGEHVEIMPGERLPAFDVGPVCAYVGRTIGLEETVSLIVLVCQRALLPREDAASTYSFLASPTLLPLVARGMINWPYEANTNATGNDTGFERRYAFVYKAVLGNVLAPMDSDIAFGAGLVAEVGPSVSLNLKQEWVYGNVILPMARLLQDFRDKDFVHGRINPHNLFYSNDKAVHKIILGECLATPPAFAQPALYETIERAMADPIGRGPGTQAQDMYAFGVMLSVLLRHADPMAKLSVDAMIRHKMDVGSYNALLENARFSGPILELLRGLLADDVTERWDISALLAWIDGRRLSPKQPKRTRIAQRPLSFAGGRYLRPDFLAMDLRKAPDQVEQFLESGEMDIWVMRALENETLRARMEKNIRTARESGRSGASYLERLACYVSMALDPNAPIRYGPLSVRPEGIGTALAHTVAREQSVDAFGQILSHGIGIHWVASQEGLLSSFADLTSHFDDCRTYIRQTRIGYGIERCLYILSPGCPCLSPNFRSFYVDNPYDMLAALEDMCSKGQAPSVLLDRHSVAFLAVRDKNAMESHLFDLSAAEPERVLMGTLKCLATLQKRTGIGALPHLSRTLATRVGPLYARYHDRSLRKQIEKNITDFCSAGQLYKMVALLDNDALARHDRMEFRRAQIDYLRITHEFRKIIEQMNDKEPFEKRTGQKAGIAVSLVLAGMIVLGIIFVYMVDKTFFPMGTF